LTEDIANADTVAHEFNAHQFYDAFRGIRQIGYDNSKASIIVDCRCTDNETISCVADPQGISDIVGQIDGFLLFFSDNSEDTRMLAQVLEAKEQVVRLTN